MNRTFGQCPLFPDLLGFGAVGPEHVVDWTLMVDVPDHPLAQRAKRIDGRLPSSLIDLPTEISGEVQGSAYSSLANRDLQRGQGVGLSSGESIARHLGVEPLDVTDRLGPVGGRIVGEVLVGIVDADPESFRSVDPDWAPTLPSRVSGGFGLADILLPAL